MGGSVNQEEYRRSLARDAAAGAARLRELGTGLDDERMRRRPAAGGWSIGEVYEHLCITDDSYLAPIRSLLARPDAARAPLGTVDWRPSFAGGLLVRGLRGSRPLPAPRSYRPGPTPRPGVVSEYLKRQAELARLLEESARHEWRRVRMRAPVSALIRLNVGDALTILVVHAARHIAQLERLRTAD